jgi:preprotein translocase subunit SecE
MEGQEKLDTKPGLSLKKAWSFWENLKMEFLKIQWTEGEEAKVYAKVVVVATFVLGLGIYFADVIIRRFLVGVDVLFKLIFG